MKTLLQHFVTNRAERCPEAVALVSNQECMRYAQLETLSNQLARVLKACGCQRGDRVCLLIPKSPIAIVSMLGSLKADCVYVPLDPASPAPRLAKMVAASAPRMILAAGPAAALVDTLVSEQAHDPPILVGWMDNQPVTGAAFTPAFSYADLHSYPGGPPDYHQTAQDAAHILFTSGSTGTPKGVVITHSNVLHFVTWANSYFEMQAADRNSGHSPLHFDLSTFDVYGTLAVGAQLHLVPPAINLLPHKLAEFIRASELTQWFSVPSILNYMAKFDVVRFGDFPALKRLLWCGEAFPTPSLIYWMQRLPHVTFTNLYGPTEATIASSYYTLPECPRDETAAVPIGTACPDEELLVLDDALQPVPPGAIGALYIRGIGLSPGYWQEPDKTRAVFLPDPTAAHPDQRMYKTGDLASVGEDGLFYFHGRADFQIKSRGYRIELGEIEVALNAMPFLRECAVVAINTDAFEGATICCAYVPTSDVNVKPAMVRTKLSHLLPTYMLPTRWKVLEQLPKNANGKIDRRALKEYFQHHGTEAN